MFSYLFSGPRRWGWLLLLGLLLLIRLGQAAPRPQAFVRQFGPAEGLAQPFIYCLLQDREGYLWLADNFVTSRWQAPASGALRATHAQGGRSVRLAPIRPSALP